MFEAKNAERLTPFEDRRMWRLLLARLHPDAGGDHDLFAFACAVRDEVSGGVRAAHDAGTDEGVRGADGPAPLPQDVAGRDGLLVFDQPRRPEELLDGLRLRAPASSRPATTQPGYCWACCCCCILCICAHIRSPASRCILIASPWSG